MIDVSKKVNTLRTATASATLSASPAAIKALRENKLPKGDPLPVAKIAAVQAAKNTSQLIPYCHPLPLDFVDCRFEVGSDKIEVTTEVKAIYKTGVEMEALVAASAAVLTLYDMMKAVDENMQILGIKLVKKTGGKSDFKPTLGKSLRAAVLVASDSVSKGKKEDTSGKFIVERLKQEGIEVAEYAVVPDDGGKIEEKLRRYANELKVNLVLTTGGTGLGPHDHTPEATAKVIDREVPGITEVLRAYGQDRTPLSMLSRGKAGVSGQTIIINLPGSKRAVTESLDALFPWLLHAFRMMEGEGHPRPPVE
jgi:molybdenum cofactor biosynthesis protein MoaC